MKHCILFMVAIFLCITSLGFAQESKDSAMFNNVLAKVSDEIPDGYNFVDDPFESNQLIPETQKFTPLTYLFNNPDTSDIKLIICDVKGDTIQFINDTIWEPGQYSIHFSQVLKDGTRIKGGIYFITLEAKTPDIESPYGKSHENYFRAYKREVYLQ